MRGKLTSLVAVVALCGVTSFAHAQTAAPKAAKDAAKPETAALLAAYQQALGVNVRTIRPSAVYGLGMNQFVGPIKAMVESAVRGEPAHFAHGGGGDQGDGCFVEDAAVEVHHFDA